MRAGKPAFFPFEVIKNIDPGGHPGGVLEIFTSISNPIAYREIFKGLYNLS
jgi:hypothetical protein